MLFFVLYFVCLFSLSWFLVPQSVHNFIQFRLFSFSALLPRLPMRAILMFHNCEGQSHKTVPTDHNFWRERRAEADSNRGPSAYQPNALPLGQTGSHSSYVKVNLVLNVHRNHRDGRKGQGVWRWGKREIIYLSLHCHHQNDSCPKLGSDESRFNVS